MTFTHFVLNLKDLAGKKKKKKKVTNKLFTQCCYLTNTQRSVPVLIDWLEFIV